MTDTPSPDEPFIILTDKVSTPDITVELIGYSNNHKAYKFTVNSQHGFTILQLAITMSYKGQLNMIEIVKSICNIED